YAECLVEDGPHDTPVGVETVSDAGGLDQFPQNGLDVARPNLPCIRSLRIKELVPVEAEELVALVGDAPGCPFGWTWVKHGFENASRAAIIGIENNKGYGNRSLGASLSLLPTPYFLSPLPFPVFLTSNTPQTTFSTGYPSPEHL